MQKENRSLLDDISICSICTETFDLKNKPLLLHCGHTFCAYCLSYLSQKSIDLKCPMCQATTKVPCKGLNTNYILESISSKQKGNIKEDEKTGRLLQDTVSVEARRKKYERPQQREKEGEEGDVNSSSFFPPFPSYVLSQMRRVSTTLRSMLDDPFRYF